MVEFLGNKDLLEREKVAFLAPSRVSPLAVLPTLDWATEIVQSGQVVVSGFSSRLEKEVFAVLARNNSPMVAVLVTSEYKKVPAKYLPLLDSGNLLIVFLGLGTRMNRQLASRRNDYVASVAAQVVFPSLTQTSMLYPLYQKLTLDGKAVKLLMNNLTI